MQHLKGMNGHEGMYCEIHSKMWGLCDCCRANMSRMRAELRRQSAPFPSVSTSLKAASYSSILPVKRMLSWACKKHSQPSAGMGHQGGRAQWHVPLLKVWERR